LAICSNCGNGFSGPGRICPQCLTLPADRPAVPDTDSADDSPVLLCKTGDMAGAELLAETLRQEGIPAVINPGTFEFRMMPLEYGQKGISIFVPRLAMEKAGELAARFLADFAEETGPNE